MGLMTVFVHALSEHLAAKETAGEGVLIVRNEEDYINLRLAKAVHLYGQSDECKERARTRWAAMSLKERDEVRHTADDVLKEGGIHVPRQ